MHDEFREIHEAWAELKTIYNEIEMLNKQAAGIRAFDAYAVPAATAR